MYAIIRLGQGAFYYSMVFGYHCEVTSEDDYERYLKSIHNQYYLVLNEKKTELMKQYIFDKNNKYLEPSVLIVDGNQADWIFDEKNQGEINLLVPYKDDEIPNEVLEKCIQMDAEYTYEETQVISSQESIDNFMWSTGGMHDACIDKVEERTDGSLHIVFSGVWECKVEVIFTDNISYSVESRNPNDCDPYWFGASIVLTSDGVILVDEEDMKEDDIGEGYCWFKAARMSYRIIPT